jgi:hypothetical protein
MGFSESGRKNSLTWQQKPAETVQTCCTPADFANRHQTVTFGTMARGAWRAAPWQHGSLHAMKRQRKVPPC